MKAMIDIALFIAALWIAAYAGFGEALVAAFIYQCTIGANISNCDQRHKSPD